MKSSNSISFGSFFSAKWSGLLSWLVWAGVLFSLGNGAFVWAKTAPRLMEAVDSGHADIGQVEKAGTAQYEAATGVYTISGAGKARGFFDACHFVYQPLEGDGQIVARVLLSPDTNRMAYAGVMVRETLTANSKNAFLVVTPTNSVALWRRINTPGLTISGTDTPSLNGPIWLKLVRQGPMIRSYYSADGANWEMAGWDAIDLPAQVLIGLAVSTHAPLFLSSAQFDQVQVTTLPAPAEVPGDGDGLRGTYFDTRGGKTLLVTQRVDPTVNFDWERGSPMSGLGVDQFNITWEGEVKPALTEPYTFHLAVNDGARLWLNNRLLIDAWAHQGFGVFASQPIELKADRRYVLKLEFCENMDKAAVKLAWSSPSTAIEIIPKARLYSQIKDQDQDGMPDDWEIEYGLNPQDSTDAKGDLDRDGLTNLQEYLAGSDPSKADTDGDGMPDLWEWQHGLKVYVADADEDADKDGLSNLKEMELGTDPMNPDTDGDGFSDGREVCENQGSPTNKTTTSAFGLSFAPLSADIGKVGLKGNVKYDPATQQFTVQGSSGDIWNVKDSFQYAYQPLYGDGEMVVRVTGIQDVKHWAKVGIMVRENLAADSRHAFIMVMPEDNDVKFHRRLNPGGETVRGHRPCVAAPVWLKLVRQGIMVCGYCSVDGVNWDMVGWEALELPSKVFIGLAVCNNDRQTLCTAQFDQVRLTALPTQALTSGDGDGLLGTYFDTRSGKAVMSAQRVDPAVNFDWELDSPMTGLARGKFSIGWEGEVKPPLAEPYTFHLSAIDGARLWLDNRLVIDAWGNKPFGVFDSQPMQFKADRRHALKLEYSEKGGRAGVKLAWSSPSTVVEIIPKARLYSQIKDQDQDGMPDDWEIEYGLNPQDPADAQGDLDKDGLTNLQEYLGGLNPSNTDTDGDGMPDLWEVNHGLRAYDPTDAMGDLDRDGLTNFEEFKAGTNPQNSDTDGDGLPDGMEVHETGTNPLESEITGIENVVQINGSDAVATLGQWKPQGSAIYAVSRRGYVEYQLRVPKTDVYQLEIEGRERFCITPVRAQPLLVSIDGENMGRFELVYDNGTNGLVHCFTPWLTAGEHRVRIFWDNVVGRYYSLLLQAIRLQAVQSLDANQNGVKDWVENQLQSRNGVEPSLSGSSAADAAAAANISTAISPVCLEGRATYLSMMSFAIGQGSLSKPEGVPVLTTNHGIAIEHGAGNRWYANLPLFPDQPTVVVTSFENNGLKVTNRFVWKPINLLEATALTVRAADTLLLTVEPPFFRSTKGGPPAPSLASADTLRIEVVGITNYSSRVQDSIAHRFDSPGLYTVKGTLLRGGEELFAHSITMKVVAAQFNGQPACWVGTPRKWECPALPTETVIEKDPRLVMETLEAAQGGREFSLVEDATEPRHTIARLGTNGPVLAHARAEGFRIYASRDLSTYIERTYPDGSRLVATELLASPVLPDVTVRVDIFVGGVTFDDGTITKTLTASDFDELGMHLLRFIRPAIAQTSVCHTTKVFQGDILIKQY